PLAAASAGVIGLAGVPYRVRRGFVPAMTRHVDSTSRPYARRMGTATEAARVISEPSFRAPWGELERQLPYVTITTQPWPEEWWRASHRPVAQAAAPVAFAGAADDRSAALVA